MSKKIEKLLKDDYLARNVPETINLPPCGDDPRDVTKPLEIATVDDIAFAVQAINKRMDTLRNELYGLQRLYEQARKNGALGCDNIVCAVTKNGGAK